MKSLMIFIDCNTTKMNGEVIICYCILLFAVVSPNAPEIYDCSKSMSPEAHFDDNSCRQRKSCANGCFCESGQFKTCARICLGEIIFLSEKYNICSGYCTGHLKDYCKILVSTTVVPPSKRTEEDFTDKPPARETAPTHFLANPLTIEAASMNYTDNPPTGEATATSFTGRLSKNDTVAKSFEEPSTKSETTMNFEGNLSKQTAKEYYRENHSTYGLVAGTVFGGVLFFAVLVAAMMLLCCCCCEKCCYYKLLKGLRKPKTQVKDCHRSSNKKRFESDPPPTPSKLSFKPSPFYNTHKGLLPDIQKQNPLYNVHRSLLGNRPEQKPNPLYDMHKSPHEHKMNLLYGMEERLLTQRQDQNQNTENYEDMNDRGSLYSTHIYAEIMEISVASCYEIPDEPKS